MRRKRVAGPAGTLAVALSLALAGCADRAPLLGADEPGRVADATKPTDDAPFYYYQGERIPLEVDPTELVIVSRAPRADEEARLLILDAGVMAGGTRELPQAHGHRLVALPASTSREAAIAARDRLREDPRIEFAAPVYRTRDSRERVVLLNRVAVAFREGTSRREIERLAARLGTRVAREPDPARGFFHHWLEYGPDVDPLEVAAVLDRHPLVEWADPDKVSDRRPGYVPTDPFFAQQYYLRNNTFFNGVRVDINAIHAWDLTIGAWAPSSGGFRIAVVDDGVEASHPDFNGSVLFGYDAFGLNHFAASNPECNHDSHGTMVAGTILSQHNNAAGGAGAAPGVLIIPIRIFRCGFVASDAQIANGLNYAWQWQGAQVVNNSWGGGLPSNAITNAINAGNTNGRSGRGTVFVFAAGNTSNRAFNQIGAVQYPATLASTVAVGAINRNGGVTNYSPEGATLDLVAPSGHITDLCVGDVITTDLMGTRGCNDGPGGNIDYTSTFSGTSAAAPQVAGVFSLLLAREPTLTSAQAKTRVYNAADWWGVSTRFGRGKVNAYRTLVGRLTAYISGTSYVHTSGQYTWSAVTSGGQQTPTYLWESSWDGMSFFPVGTGTTYTRWVSQGETFHLRLTVEQGPDDARAVSQMTIYSPQPCIQDPWYPLPCLEEVAR